jgi:hypothetical protein
MGEVRNEYETLVGKPEGNRPLGDLGVGGITSLDCMRMFTRFNCLKIEPSGGLL